MKLKKVSDLFDVKYGNSLSLQECKLDSTGIPFVSRGSSNNGIDDYIEELENVRMNPANTISVAVGGSVMESFLQKEPYYTGYHVLVLTPKEEMTEQEMLFYCTCLRSNKYKYNYGRQANSTLKDLLIPDRSEIPDWVYTTHIDTPNENPLLSTDTPTLDTSEWKEFRYDEIFDIIKCKAYNIDDFSSNGNVPYVTRTANNNGILDFINTNEQLNRGNCIIIGGESSVFFYQSEEFIAGTNITALYSDKLNNYNSLFITTVGNLDKYRFNYGRASNLQRIKKLSIKLPVDKKGNPDWDYMENYIKTLKYSGSI